jgi:AAA family ATP:ADP antiporter
MTTSESRLDTWIGILSACLIIAHQVAGKATRDALFLANFPVEDLPKLMILSALLSVVAVVGVSRQMASLGPGWLMPRLYAVSAVLFLVEWLVMASFPQLVVVGLYLHISVFGAILISGFWSVINELHDPYSAKRVFARLTAAATLGGLAGGLAAKGMAEMADTRAILLLLGGMHLLSALGIWRLGRGLGQQDKGNLHRGRGFGRLLPIEPLRRSQLIRRMALLVMLVSTVAALLDYLLKATASVQLSQEELIHFFSWFYIGVGLGSFLLQSLLGSRLLKLVGVSGAMAAWPLLVMLGGFGVLLMHNLASTTLLRAGTQLLSGSLFRSGFELLYTPIPAADKRAGKLLIDVGGERAGDLVGALLVMGLLILPGAMHVNLLLTAFLLALACLGVIAILHRNYVGQLADNLHSARSVPEGPAGLQPLPQTSSANVLHRNDLIQQIEQMRTRTEVHPQAARVDRDAVNEPIMEAIRGLRSDSPERIRWILASHPLDALLLPHAIPLLRDDRVLAEVLQAMRSCADACAGQLADALGDRLQHPLVRRRIPLVLSLTDNPLGITCLLKHLGDPDPNVRFRSAQALKRIRHQHPHLAIDTGLAEIRLEQEAEAIARQVHEHRATLSDSRLRQRVRHLFDLLAILHEPATLDLTFGALLGDDPGARGTALELLENLLPENVRLAVWPLLAGDHTGGAARQRSLQQIAGELKKRVKSHPHHHSQTSET